MRGEAAAGGPSSGPSRPVNPKFRSRLGRGRAGAPGAASPSLLPSLPVPDLLLLPPVDRRLVWLRSSSFNKTATPSHSLRRRSFQSLLLRSLQPRIRRPRQTTDAFHTPSIVRRVSQHPVTLSTSRPRQPQNRALASTKQRA